MKKGTLRKVVALGAGLTMLGATVFGAMAAADLADYPSPLLIQDGKFNAKIVVGENAAVDDVLGSIEATAGLQTAAVTTVDTGVGRATASVDTESVQIKQTGRLLSVNDSINDVFGAPIDFSDLPTLLAEGTFDDNEGNNKNKETYTQELDFTSSSGRFDFVQADSNELDDASDFYFWFDDGTDDEVYTYNLEFNSPIDYDSSTSTTVSDDLENNRLEILGQVYTITDVEQDGSGYVDKMELLAGETVVWLTQGEPITRSIQGVEHIVTLADVNEDENKCGIDVDGTIVWVDDGDTETISGVEVGVTDAIVVHSAGKDTDVCEVNVGASKITLEEGQEVQRDDVDIDESNTLFQFNGGGNGVGTAGEWEGFTITLDVADQFYLTPGDNYVEPVFDAFQFDFAGTSANTETIEWKRVGSDGAELEFKNYDGKDVKVEWEIPDDASPDGTAANSSAVIMGKDANDRLLQDGDVFDCGTDEDSCEGVKLWVVTNGHEIHVLEISNVKNTSSTSEIDFDDETYGRSFDEEDFTFDGSDQAVELSSLGTITMSIDTTGLINVSTLNLGSGNPYTTYQGKVTLQNGVDLDPANGGSSVNLTDFQAVEFNITEPDDELENGINNDGVWSIRGTVDTTNDEIDFSSSGVVYGSATNGWSDFGAYDKSDTDDETEVVASIWGTLVEYDTNDDKGGTLTLPEEQLIANAFISKVGGVVTTSSGAQSISLTQIEVGSAKLDSEISDVTAQNLLVVGGPCANSVAASLMGNPEDCTEGFAEGEALIKLFEQANGNVAVLAAGFSADDTRRATTVLANYKDYTLSGTEVKVKGTTLTDVTVESVTA